MLSCGIKVDDKANMKENKIVTEKLELKKNIKLTIECQLVNTTLK